MVSQPHFLLFCDTHVTEPQFGQSNAIPRTTLGRWHFVLEQLDGSERLEAADSEYSVNRERLALLSVVRGLEALEQPSQVTLVTTSRYVSRGLRYGLSTWRESDYKWERFGEQKPIRNSDLWRRVDVAMHYHGVKCRLIEAGHHAAAPSHLPALGPQAAEVGHSLVGPAQEKNLAGVRRISEFPASVVGASSSLNTALASRGLPTQPNGRLITPRFRNLASQFELKNMKNWWGLAQAWIRWWRGRMQARPAFYSA